MWIDTYTSISYAQALNADEMLTTRADQTSNQLHPDAIRHHGPIGDSKHVLRHFACPRTSRLHSLCSGLLQQPATSATRRPGDLHVATLRSNLLRAHTRTSNECTTACLPACLRTPGRHRKRTTVPLADRKRPPPDHFSWPAWHTYVSGTVLFPHTPLPISCSAAANRSLLSPKPVTMGRGSSGSCRSSSATMALANCKTTSWLPNKGLRGDGSAAHVSSLHLSVEIGEAPVVASSIAWQAAALLAPPRSCC
ncbi:uncharacterized protein F5Z01DRAFT_394533 [Emericellopsis atlantica]|uniref:Uncharacterized protein n=1 Tax=Emericellopsis atlantica TaxID=2614577 RepID=A0A9P8CST6_9HYPO|nr:uncharacterized protein F5Z01DRAFT_394533 [Emericellopsis atlantica]KAG9257535.1 hypothetical protein F5Z01DRAFT_394533 [Emericellopsis atlantica]